MTSLATFGAPSPSFPASQPPLCGHPTDPPRSCSLLSSLPAHRGISPYHIRALKTGTMVPPITHLAVGTEPSWHHPRSPSPVPPPGTVILGCYLSPRMLPSAPLRWPNSRHLKSDPEGSPGQAFLKQPNRATQQEVKAAAFNLLEK